MLNTRNEVSCGYMQQKQEIYHRRWCRKTQEWEIVLINTVFCNMNAFVSHSSAERSLGTAAMHKCILTNKKSVWIPTYKNSFYIQIMENKVSNNLYNITTIMGDESFTFHYSGTWNCKHKTPSRCSWDLPYLHHTQQLLYSESKNQKKCGFESLSYESGPKLHADRAKW